MSSTQSLQARTDHLDTTIRLLRQNGYALVQGFASKEIVHNLMAETINHQARVNLNELGPVFHGATQFFTNIIGHSKTACSLILSRFVVDLCSSYFGSGFELVNNRIQTTHAKISMPWHTDNNLLANGRLIGRHAMPGLNFILYLTDVSRAPFQLVLNSQEWSLDYGSQYLSDSEISRLNHQVIDVIPKPGDLLILNTHIFHRASPISDDKYSRSILLFQVDQISNDYPGHGETLYINPGLIDNLSPTVLTFLGFGRHRAYLPFPEASVTSLGVSQLAALQLDILKLLPRAAIIKIIKQLIPSDVLTKLKNKIVSNRSSHSDKQSRASTSPYLNF